jgi:hypothetical protein
MTAPARFANQSMPLSIIEGFWKSSQIWRTSGFPQISSDSFSVFWNTVTLKILSLICAPHFERAAPFPGNCPSLGAVLPFPRTIAKYIHFPEMPSPEFTTSVFSKLDLLMSPCRAVMGENWTIVLIRYYDIFSVLVSHGHCSKCLRIRAFLTLAVTFLASVVF